jgi:hypothetical protein
VTQGVGPEFKPRPGTGGLLSVILATQEAKIRKITVQSQPGQTVQETLSQKTLHTHTHTKTTGLAEWLKVKALSSGPSTTKNK